MKQVVAPPLLLLLASVLAGPAVAQERAAGEYPLSAESLVQACVAEGTLEGPFEFRAAAFPGSVRRYWVYVPNGYDPARPPNLLVFQDGQRATNPEGSLRVPAVLDNLIAQGAIPPTLGVFVTPGNLSEHYPPDLGMSNPDHRAAEYDALDDTYVRMLTEELLPEVARRWRFADAPAFVIGNEKVALASKHIFDAREAMRDHRRCGHTVARGHAAEIEGFLDVLGVAHPA